MKQLNLLQGECARALEQLEDVGRDQCRAVRDYIEALEKTANERGELLKGLAESALGPRPRQREITGRFVQNAEVFLLSVVSYDVSWLVRLTAVQQEPTLLLRPKEPEEVWISGVPSEFLVAERSEPGDLILKLRTTDFRQGEDGGGEARFDVISIERVKPSVLPTAPLSARAIEQAIESGQVRVVVQRTAQGFGVLFEDAPT
jgi:hypothetical protein